MNGQFQLGNVNPFKYFFGLSVFFAILFTLVIDRNGQNIGLFFIQWLLQTSGMMLLFITCHVFISRQCTTLVAWQALCFSGLLASLVFSPLSLLIDIYANNESIFSWLSIAEEWMAMAPPSIACWLIVNLPLILDLKFTDSNQNKYRYDLNSQKIKLKTPNTVFDDSDPLLPNQGDITLRPSNINKSIELPVVTKKKFEKLEENISDDFTQIIDTVGVENLLLLKSELHYLSVVTTENTHLILYSLKAAIARLNTQYNVKQDGQVHRSYWANQHQVISLKKFGREGKLQLPNNHHVLVSRTHLTKVKAWVS